MTKQNDISWINLVKVTCIVLIFLNHSEIYTENALPFVRSIYAPFFVNAFFVVSGFLFFRKHLSEPLILEDRKQYVSKKGGGWVLINNILWKIAIPSFIFALINFFPMY